MPNWDTNFFGKKLPQEFLGSYCMLLEDIALPGKNVKISHKIIHFDKKLHENFKIDDGIL